MKDLVEFSVMRDGPMWLSILHTPGGGGHVMPCTSEERAMKLAVEEAILWCLRSKRRCT